MKRCERIIGAVYGHLVGDAFGVPYEFKDPTQLPRQLTWRGFGTHNQPPGTWSDDGALMLCLLESLVTCNRFDPADAGQRFVAWFNHGHMAAGGKRFDIGSTTHTAIDRLARGVPPLEAGPNGERENGNGSLMRILPLALWAHREPIVDFLGLLHNGSRMTHGHPCAQACCGVYGLILRHLLSGGARADAWMSALNLAEQTYAASEPWRTAFVPEIARIRAFNRCHGTGFVVDCLCSAWTAVAAADDTADAIQRAVRYGNDTDTTAAVAGSLAGAALGLGESAGAWAAELRLTVDQRKVIDAFAAAVVSAR